MQRLAEWPEKLAAYLDAQRVREFVWGEHDCAQFVAGAIEAMTGENPMAKVEEYGSRFGAARAIALRGRTLGDAWAKVSGLMEVDPARAMRGDVVLSKVGSEKLLGVLNLRGSVSVLTEGGLMMISRTCAVKAWRV